MRWLSHRITQNGGLSVKAATSLDSMTCTKSSSGGKLSNK